MTVDLDARVIIARYMRFVVFQNGPNGTSPTCVYKQFYAIVQIRAAQRENSDIFYTFASVIRVHSGKISKNQNKLMSSRWILQKLPFSMNKY